MRPALSPIGRSQSSHTVCLATRPSPTNTVLSTRPCLLPFLSTGSPSFWALLSGPTRYALQRMAETTDRRGGGGGGRGARGSVTVLGTWQKHPGVREL